MTAKVFIRETIWLIAIAFTTLILIYSSPGSSFSPECQVVIDIQFHDTYFVTNGYHVFIFMFLNIAFWVHLIKVAVKKFNELSSNWTLLIISGLLIFVTSQLIQFMSALGAGNWAIHTPGGLQEVAPTFDQKRWRINDFLGIYRIFQTVVLGLIGIVIGKNFKKNSTT